MRSNSAWNVARLRSTHSTRSTTAGVSSALGQLRADLGGNDRLDAEQRGPVEGLGLGPLRLGDGRRGRSEPAVRDLPHHVPVDQTRARAADDLARRDAGAEGEETADDDAGGELCGVASHRAQSRGSATPTGSSSTDSTGWQPVAEEKLGDGDERGNVPGGGDPAHRRRAQIRGRPRVERVEEVLDGEGRRERRVDHGHRIAHDPLDRTAQKRVVRAAQQQRVHAWTLRQQRLEVGADDRLGAAAVDHAGLDQRDELRAGQLGDADGGVGLGDGS